MTDSSPVKPSMVQKIKDRVRIKARKTESQSEEYILNNKSKDENVDDVETEEGEKRETTRIQTAPAELGNPKETADEWDASKTPPSRFQQKKGSVYATPNSRDSHIDRHADRDSKFHELHDKKFGSGKGKNGSPKGEA